MGESTRRRARISRFGASHNSKSAPLGRLSQWIERRNLQAITVRSTGICRLSFCVLALASVLVFLTSCGETKPSETAIRETFAAATAGEAKTLVPVMSFRWCPAGSFTMGTTIETGNEFAVEVTLTQGFWLAETELTQAQWRNVMMTVPWKGQDDVKEGDDFPASFISHDDAAAFCQKLTKTELAAGRLPKGWIFGLPTSAQWEYACRAGTKTDYSFGDDESLLRDYAWFNDNSLNAGEKYAHGVGQKEPNGWGFEDMHGNISEWCLDWEMPNLSGGRDPIELGQFYGTRVTRGGSWIKVASNCVSANRWGLSPGFQSRTSGFRVAAVLEKEELPDPLFKVSVFGVRHFRVAKSAKFLKSVFQPLPSKNPSLPSTKTVVDPTLLGTLSQFQSIPTLLDDRTRRKPASAGGRSDQ